MDKIHVFQGLSDVTDSAANQTPKSTFVKELKEIEEILKESIQCLQYEPERTKEALTYKAAKKALSDIGEILFFADFI